jgi:hypothetical protein
VPARNANISIIPVRGNYFKRRQGRGRKKRRGKAHIIEKEKKRNTWRVLENLSDAVCESVAMQGIP